MKRKLLISLILILIVGGSVLAALEIHKTVSIEIDGQAQTVRFWGLTVDDALANGGIPIVEGDVIFPSLGSRLHEDETVSILRAFQVVIAADGESQTLWTTERQPAKLLALSGIHLNPGDQLLANGSAIDPEELLPYAAVHTLQVRREIQVTLDNGSSIQTIQSTANTLGEALWEAGISLYSADHLTPPSDTPLEGQDIHASLERSQEVVIRTKDRVVQTRVVASTVGEALSDAGMALQGLDYSIPLENDPIPKDGHIRVVQVREEIILEQEPLPFGVQYQALPEVDLDTQQVVQVGEYGLTARRVRVVYEDGEEISRSVEDEWVAKNPKPRIVGYGTKITIQTVQTPDGPIEYWRKVDVYATSYSPCNIGIPGQCGSRTASGKEVAKGMIAVIRSWYNMMKGLPVYVTTYGFATIEDIGAGFADRHWIDLAFTDEEYRGWSGHVSLYFLTPIPANVMWMLE